MGLAWPWRVTLEERVRHERFIRGCSEPSGTPASYLDTLALAYFQTGAPEEAVKTAERALDLLPPGAPPTGLRGEIESHLAQFRGR